MSLEDIPLTFADYFGINDGTAKVILSIVVIFAILLPYLIMAHKSPSPMVSLILVFLGECLLVGIGWLDFWVLIGTIVMMSMSVAFISKGIVGDK